LRTAASSSRSASPAARRGTSTRGKKPVAKPSFTGRRSKAEREALEKLGRDRERERQKELDKEEKAKWREKPKRGGLNTRGRGGHTGAISGPFSLGNVGIGKHASGAVGVVAHDMEQIRSLLAIERLYRAHAQHG
jgi:DNA-directed RNA polymerase III subunit RPC4